MGIIQSLFRKKNLTMPLTDKRPLITVIGGQTRYFERTSNESDLSKELIEAYNTLSEVSAPINKIADLASVVIPVLTDKDGNKINDPLIDKLLKQPNKTQNWQEYYRKLTIYRILLGNAYENAYGYLGKSFNFELKLLPPQYTKINIKSRADFRNVEIENYEIKVQGWSDIVISDINTVLHQKQTSPYFGKNADLYGYPKLASVMANIESIRSGYDAKIGLYKHGPALVITGKTIGEFAAANMSTNEDVQELQQRINDEYGLNQNQFSVLVTDIPLDVTKVSMNVGELKINENNISDFQAICRALDIPSVLLSDDTRSTYNNMKEARSAWLNESFTAMIENDYAQRSAWLSMLLNKEVILKPDYKNIPEIIAKQTDNNDNYLLLAQLGLITRNEYLTRIGEDEVNNAEFNEYYTYTSGEWMPVVYDENESNQNDEENTEIGFNINNNGKNKTKQNIQVTDIGFR